MCQDMHSAKLILYRIAKLVAAKFRFSLTCSRLTQAILDEKDDYGAVY